MIKSFRNEAARAAYERRFVKGVPQNVLRIGNRKLLQLHNARSLNDLRAPPGNHLEALSGRRKGQYSHQRSVARVLRLGQRRCRRCRDRGLSLLSSLGGDAMADFRPSHPGEVLREDFLRPLGMSQYALAKALGVPEIRISEIVHGKRAITPDTALRLARYFGTSAEFWLGMQTSYDLERSRECIGAEIEATVRPRAA